MKVYVKKCRLGWGLTDGEKWFFYAYPTQEAAEGIKASFDAGDSITHEVNISYPEPLQLVKPV